MVLTTHLLSDHDSEGSKGSPSNSRNGEKFLETADKGFSPQDKTFGLQLSVNIVKVSGSLQRGETKPKQ